MPKEDFIKKFPDIKVQQFETETIHRPEYWRNRNYRIRKIYSLRQLLCEGGVPFWNRCL